MVTVVAALSTAVVVGALVSLIITTRGNRDVPAQRNRQVLPGLEVSRTQYWAATGAMAAVTFATVFALTGLVVVSAVPALVLAWLPRAYFIRRHNLRKAAVQEAWPDGIRDILSSIRSGASLARAVEEMAAFGPEPLRQAFHGFGAYARSLGVVSALELIKEDLADPASDRIVEVLILAHERGGAAVPEILVDLADAATKDLWTAEEVKTEALEQKINSRVVFVLPWIVLIAMTARPGPFRDFYGTATGVGVVALGGVLSLVGILMASRLGASPAEPRVFEGRR